MNLGPFNISDDADYMEIRAAIKAGESEDQIRARLDRQRLEREERLEASARRQRYDEARSARLWAVAWAVLLILILTSLVSTIIRLLI